MKMAIWHDCPGCPKCKETGGYVLRLGSGRCTTAHEYIFVLAKGPRYFWDSVASAEASTYGKLQAGFRGVGSQYTGGKSYDNATESKARTAGIQRDDCASRNPRSVWTLSSEPTSERHFVTFPSELVRRCLAAGISAGGCCAKCGAPLAPMIESERVATRPGTGAKTGGDEANRDAERHVAVTKTNGYRPTCRCGAGVAPCVVLDPFSGIGTVAQTAHALGARAIGIDLNEAYHQVAMKRVLQEPRWMLRLRTKKPPKVATNQRSLFAKGSP